MRQRVKSKGEIAYEQDVCRKPTYHDGSKRKTFSELSQCMRYSWEKNPAPRKYP